jgi:hypothetical protein
MPIVFAVLAVMTGVRPARPAHCQFHEANQLVHRWEGSCGHLFDQEPKMKLRSAKAIATGRWRRDADPTAVWAGDMTDEGSPNADLELELYGAPGASGVLRTEYGWYAVSAFKSTANSITFDLDTTASVTPNDIDREIVRRADALLSSVSVWNRADNRRCPGSAKTWSIYCAMQRAAVDASCGTHHRRPAMETVRVIVDERSAKRNYDHRLMDYNNDSTTTLADVRSLFVEALSRMGGTADGPLSPPMTCPPPPQPTFTAVDLKIVDRAREILGSPAKWSKTDGQECPAGQKTLGIFCAFKQASEETIGEWDEVAPFMREARQLVDSLAKRKYNARLVDYNNDPDVSFADLQSFFRILRDRLSKRVE